MPLEPGRRLGLVPFLLVGAVSCLGDRGESPLTVDVPLSLVDHLDVATVVDSEVPAERVAAVRWDFDEPLPDWAPVDYPRGSVQPTRVTHVEDALRLELTEAHRVDERRLLGLVSAHLPDYRFGDWGTVLVRARSSSMVGTLHVGFNLSRRAEAATGLAAMAWSASGDAPVIGDGAVHTYAFRVDQLDGGRGGPRVIGSRTLDVPMRQIALRLFAEVPSNLDILSVTLAPVAASYLSPVGAQTETFDGLTFQPTLYIHAPGRIEFPVEVPEGGRLDFALGKAGEAGPVIFRVTALTEVGEEESLFEESLEEDVRLAQPRSVDLSPLVGRDVSLSLEADATREGAVALWSAPTISGVRTTDRPNVVFYVIDGGSADHMSSYGYNRRTTPNLERLAAAGALFENAYSNSTHTEASTPSFVTSLHTSVILGDPEGDAVVPEQGVSLAERLGAVGYQTALLTDNPNAGRWAGVERGADMFGDAFPSDLPGFSSSKRLHDIFWSWRDAYPGEPYLIHFQTTDVHRPWASVAPFAGLFLPADLRRRAMDLEDRLTATFAGDPKVELSDKVGVYEKLGVDISQHLSALAALYDEAMAEQDFLIGQLVKQLKARGQWENTLLIVAADHSHWAGGLRDPRLNPYDPMFRRAITHVPLLFVWPGRIPGGQRFEEPVSMIDVMPTIVDLIGLPEPTLAQGQSLAPLILGRQGWVPRPVILDEFVIDSATGLPTGVIEVIDGRWGASLQINPSTSRRIESARSTPLLLYDLWNDPLLQQSLHAERPDLVEHYMAFLEARFREHRALAKRFTGPSGREPLTPEELERLRALGYI